MGRCRFNSPAVSFRRSATRSRSHRQRRANGHVHERGSAVVIQRFGLGASVHSQLGRALSDQQLLSGRLQRGRGCRCGGLCRVVQDRRQPGGLRLVKNLLWPHGWCGSWQFFDCLGARARGPSHGAGRVFGRSLSPTGPLAGALRAAKERHR